MRRTFRTAFVTGTLAWGVVLGPVVSSARAQAPVRPASGSQGFASTRSPGTPPAGNANARSRATAAAPASGYYYPSRAAAAASASSRVPAPSGYYYPAPAAVSPRGGYYDSNPAAPATGRPGPARIRRGRSQPRPGDDDDYAYKS